MTTSAVLTQPSMPEPMQEGTSPTSPGVTFDVDCTLLYEVAGPAEFLFQIHALQGMDQQVLSELLAPSVPVRVYADPALGHRYARLHAEAGTLQLRYQARVHRMAAPVDLKAPEVPITELPDALLHDLVPTRYCESDLLGGAAHSACSAAWRPGTRACRPSPTGFTTTSTTASAPPRPRPPRVTFSCSAPGCAATMRTWASPFVVR
jgi:hypothetical protein